MGLRQGSIAYSRFAVSGSAPSVADGALYESLHDHRIRPDGAGNGTESVSGWITGRHVFDTEFSYGSCGFGMSLAAAMRVDTAKVPADIRRAYRAMAEDEARGPAGADGELRRLARHERMQAKEHAERRCMDEISAGMWRRVKQVPVLWDIPGSMLYAPAASDALSKELRSLCEAAFEVRIDRLGAAGLAAKLLDADGRGGELEDIRPDALTARPSGQARDDGEQAPKPMGDGRPEVPWCAHEPLDFLGNLFLLWLWWRSSEHRGEIETAGETVHVMIDRVLDMTCAWGVGGSQNLRGDGPAASAEARKALQAGKWPRRCGLVVVASGQQWMLTLQGESLSVSGLVIPQPEEPDEHERATIERRVDSMLTFDRTLVAMYRAFLEERLGRRWSATSNAMRDWIARAGAAPAAASRREAQVAEA